MTDQFTTMEAEAVRAKLADPEVRWMLFDGCHKIWLLTNEERKEFTSYGWTDEDYVHKSLDIDTAFGIVSGWWEKSCFLRFVQTGGSDRDVVPQFGFDDDPEIEDEDEDESEDDE